jgi:hypothetical protein
MMRQMIVLAVLATGCNETPWALVNYPKNGAGGGTIIMGRFNDLETCKKIKLLWERDCDWDDFERTNVLPCQASVSKISSLTCEKK